MALEVQAAIYVLGTIAFFFFWILAVFPRFPAMPIGRTSGALLGAALMVIFQIESTHQAYASVDLPILGLLFGTMVVTIYLERAGLFTHLGDLLSWGEPGAKGLMCRLCVMVAITSALFTNDTVCVAMTGFVLKLCRDKGLSAEPFLVALATSANIGSAATPIGNPQNLIIAVQGKIPFGKFLVKLLPSVVVGIFINTILLLCVYRGRLYDNVPISKKIVTTMEPSFSSELSIATIKGDENNIKEIGYDFPQAANNTTLVSCEMGTMVQSTPTSLPAIKTTTKNPYHQYKKKSNAYHNDCGIVDGQIEDVETQKQSDNFLVEITKQPSENCNESIVNKAITCCDSSHYKERGEDVIIRSYNSSEGEVQGSKKWGPLVAARKPRPLSVFLEEDIMKDSKARMRMFRKLSVFLVTIGMLVALLYGLDMSWSALTAAVVLMVLDFKDSGSSLDKVSYSLLVFFSGMFITVDGFNRTKIPGLLWSKFEPIARINHPSGIVMLSIVIIILSNVASNVPTVLLLGPQVAASTYALHGASSTKAWLILAWVSTLAGNLTLLGSAANLIVSEQAKRDELSSTNLSCTKHLRFGPLSTCIITFVGLPLIHLTMLHE